METQLFRFQRTRIRIVQPYHLTRPWNSHLGNKLLPKVVFGRLFDGPIFSRCIVYGKTHGKRLVVLGICLVRSMQLVGLCLRFGTRNVLGTRKWQQVAQLGGIHKIGSGKCYGLLVAEVLHIYGTHLILFHSSIHYFVLRKQNQLLRTYIRCHHLHKYAYCHLGFVTELRHRSGTRIEVLNSLSLLCERIVLFIIRTDGCSEVAVKLRGAMCFNPHVLVGWNALLRKLSAYPIGLFGKHYRKVVA